MGLMRAKTKPARTVLITGAASGIGQALAVRYAEPGRQLLLLDRAEATGTAQQVTARGATAQVATADVRDAEAVREAVTELAAGATLDRVVHCAGVIAPTRPIGEVDPEDVRRVLEINVAGTFNVVHGVLPHLARGSHLAMVSSLGGLVAGYRYVAYSSSKFGVVGLAEVVRMELAPLGIRTQVICPGEVTTPLIDEELASGDQVQRSLKLLSGAPITAERAGELIQAGIESGRFMVIPTVQARMLWRSTRFLPTPLRHAFTDREIRRAGARS